MFLWRCQLVCGVFFATGGLQRIIWCVEESSQPMLNCVCPDVVVMKWHIISWFTKPIFSVLRQHVKAWIDFHSLEPQHIFDHFTEFAYSTRSFKPRRLFLFVWLCNVYVLSNERNHILFSNKARFVMQLLERVQITTLHWLKAKNMCFPFGYHIWWQLLSFYIHVNVKIITLQIVCMLCLFIVFNIYIFILCSTNVKNMSKLYSLGTKNKKIKNLWRRKQLILFFKDEKQNLIYL